MQRMDQSQHRTSMKLVAPLLYGHEIWSQTSDGLYHPVFNTDRK